MRKRLCFSPRQVRAARALLGWPLERLAKRAGIEPEGLQLFEAGDGILSAPDQERVAVALYADGAGVIAICAAHAGEGVRFAQPVGGEVTRTTFAWSSRDMPFGREASDQ